MRDAAEDVSPKARAGNHAVEVIADGPESVTTSVLDVQQILENLFDNAVKFSRPSTPVTVTVRGDAAGVTVEITNEGEPLSAEELQHAFVRFYRGHRAVADAAPGSGVGLTIARALASRTGGEVTLASSEGGVITARLRLPRSV